MSTTTTKIEDLFLRQRRKQAMECFYEGYHAQMDKKYARAIEMYQKSLRMSPTAEAHTFLGWTYSFLGELESAIEECRRAIEIDPDFGNPYNDIGAYLIAQGKYEEAFPYLKQALSAKRYRAFHFAHYNLARIYEHQGDLLNAFRHYRQAVKLEPRYFIAKHGLDRVKQQVFSKN